jgi:hypothetical protein
MSLQVGASTDCNPDEAVLHNKMEMNMSVKSDP